MRVAIGSVVMTFVLGMGCVLWTVYELLRLSHETPALVRARGPEAQPVRVERRKQRRHPRLGARDRSGAALVVEDVVENAAR